MTINDFKTLDEMPWGNHRLMGDFSLRQNELVRNDSYWNILKFFRDEIISNEEDSDTMEIDSNKKNMAYYIILKEKKQGGFDIEKVFVPFNKNSLLSSIYSSDMPTKTKILSYLK